MENSECNVESAAAHTANDGDDDAEKIKRMKAPNNMQHSI